MLRASSLLYVTLSSGLDPFSHVHISEINLLQRITACKAGVAFYCLWSCSDGEFVARRNGFSQGETRSDFATNYHLVITDCFLLSAFQGFSMWLWTFPRPCWPE